MLVAILFAVGVGLAALGASFVVAALLVLCLERATDRHREPAWWPQFEREFADYVAAQNERTGTEPS